jgi:hypothetical protein
MAYLDFWTYLVKLMFLLRSLSLFWNAFSLLSFCFYFLIYAYVVHTEKCLDGQEKIDVEILTDLHVFNTSWMRNPGFEPTFLAIVNCITLLALSYYRLLAFDKLFNKRFIIIIIISVILEPKLLFLVMFYDGPFFILKY